MSRQERKVSKISSPDVLTEANIIIHVTLSINSDIESLSDRQWYAWIHFIELSTTTESNGSPRHSKGEQKFYAGHAKRYTSVKFICILEIKLK